jgi:hypothetical protein
VAKKNAFLDSDDDDDEEPGFKKPVAAAKPAPTKKLVESDEDDIKPAPK